MIKENTLQLDQTTEIEIQTYDYRICCIDTAISCDHTFKVPVNIGIWVCQKWVKIYKSLFIVLNNETKLIVAGSYVATSSSNPSPQIS